MLKLPLVLALLVVGQNHARLSSTNLQKLAMYRKMLENAEEAGKGDKANAGKDNPAGNDNSAGKDKDNAATAKEDTAPSEADNTQGDKANAGKDNPAGNDNSAGKDKDNAATAKEDTAPSEDDNTAGNSTKGGNSDQDLSGKPEGTDDNGDSSAKRRYDDAKELDEYDLGQYNVGDTGAMRAGIFDKKKDNRIRMDLEQEASTVRDQGLKLELKLSLL